MKSKKAQSLPMNTIILAIIAIVVLVIIIVFFIGGTSSIAQRIKELFTGSTSGTDLSTAKQFCQDYCDQGRYTAWCNKYFKMDINVDNVAEKTSSGAYIKYYCGSPNIINAGDDVNKDFIGLTCSTIKPDCSGLIQ